MLNNNRNITNIQISIEDLLIKDEGTKVLAEALTLQKNLHYIKLDFKNTGITDDGGTRILKVIQYH